VRVAGRGRRQRARTKAQTKATVASHLPQRRPTIPQLDHPTPSGKEPAVRSLSLAAVLTGPTLRGRSRSRRHRCHRSALLSRAKRSVYRAARLSSIARQQSRADDPGTPSAISASLFSCHVRRAHHPVHQPADLDLLGTLRFDVLLLRLTRSPRPPPRSQVPFKCVGSCSTRSSSLLTRRNLLLSPAPGASASSPCTSASQPGDLGSLVSDPTAAIVPPAAADRPSSRRPRAISGSRPRRR
jgi:hypothetical protein